MSKNNAYWIFHCCLIIMFDYRQSIDDDYHQSIHRNCAEKFKSYCFAWLVFNAPTVTAVVAVAFVLTIIMTNKIVGVFFSIRFITTSLFIINQFLKRSSPYSTVRCSIFNWKWKNCAKLFSSSSFHFKVNKFAFHMNDLPIVFHLNRVFCLFFAISFLMMERMSGRMRAQKRNSMRKRKKAIEQSIANIWFCQKVRIQNEFWFSIRLLFFNLLGHLFMFSKSWCRLVVF